MTSRRWRRWTTAACRWVGKGRRRPCFAGAAAVVVVTTRPPLSVEEQTFGAVLYPALAHPLPLRVRQVGTLRRPVRTSCSDFTLLVYPVPSSCSIPISTRTFTKRHPRSQRCRHRRYVAPPGRAGQLPPGKRPPACPPQPAPRSARRPPGCPSLPRLCQVAEYRRQLGVRVSGFDAPNPIKSFAQARRMGGGGIDEWDTSQGSMHSPVQACTSGATWMCARCPGCRHAAAHCR